MATLKLEIVTPEEKIYSEDVEMVTLPGSEGELGVYPKRVPLLTTLKPGELRVVKSGRESTMAIGEGFVEIKGDAVSVLTDMRIPCPNSIESNPSSVLISRSISSPAVCRPEFQQVENEIIGQLGFAAANAMLQQTGSISGSGAGETG